MNETLTLAQAIREGAKLHKKGDGMLAYMSGDEYRTCALGAAYVGGLGKLPCCVVEDEDDGAGDYERLKVRFPELDARVDYPVEGHTFNIHPAVKPTLEAAIIELNDTEKWPREQIADWVEGLNLHASA